MPFLNAEKPSNNGLFKILLYGLAKTKKSWWAAKIAESGFNVIYIACEPHAIGSAILNDLSPEAKARIFYVDATDEVAISVTSKFLQQILKGNEPIKWRNEKKCKHMFGDVAEGETVTTFDARLWDKNTVVVVDPWSKIVDSLSREYDEEHNRDSEAAAKTEWDGYGWVGRRATFIIQQLISLQCHVVLIAHEQHYEKKKTIYNTEKQKDEQVTEFTRIQIKSTSGPHAMTIPGNFRDILYFKTQGISDMAASIQIDTRLENGRDGGCVNLPPKVWKWEDCSFKRLCNEAGIEIPPTDLSHEIPGILQGLPEPVVIKQVEKPKSPTPLNLSSLGGLTAGKEGNIKNG